MPTYITLFKLTPKGAANIKDAPVRIKKNIEAFEAAGNKLIGFYAVLGEYDYVAIGESPSDEAAAAFSLATAALGNVTTTTLRAFTQDQFAEIVKKVG